MLRMASQFSPLQLFSHQIRKLQQVAKDLEERIKILNDDIAQRADETDKLRVTFQSTSPDDLAYVSTNKIDTGHLHDVLLTSPSLTSLSVLLDHESRTKTAFEDMNSLQSAV